MTYNICSKILAHFRTNDKYTHFRSIKEACAKLLKKVLHSITYIDWCNKHNKSRLLANYTYTMDACLSDKRKIHTNTTLHKQFAANT